MAHNQRAKIEVPFMVFTFLFAARCRQKGQVLSYRLCFAANIRRSCSKSKTNMVSG